MIEKERDGEIERAFLNFSPLENAYFIRLTKSVM